MSTEQIDYNSQLSLAEAHARCNKPKIRKLIDGPIRDLFIKYSVTKEFGLYLLHRHEHLDGQDVVYRFNGSSVVVVGKGGRVHGGDGGLYPAPSTWMLSRGETVDIEWSVFGHVGFMRDTSSVEPPPAFASELASLLICGGWERLFGIIRKSPSAFYEEHEDKYLSPAGKKPRKIIETDGGIELDPARFYPIVWVFKEDGDIKHEVHGYCEKDL